VKARSRTTARHLVCTSTTAGRSFVDFLESLLATVLGRPEVLVILDKLSVHQRRLVQRLLADHATLKVHFAPTYSSWLEQVELWFSKIERDLIARGFFTSVKDPARKLMCYIERCDLNPETMSGSWPDPDHRIHSSGSAVTDNC